MLTLNIDLGSETETRLRDFATQSGLSVDEAVRNAVAYFYTHIAENDSCPPECAGEPHPDTLESIAQIERGEGKEFNNFSELMADLNAED
ncbi:MAG: hypothetical protein QM537_09445 [Candidatus Symbiobacter sp.]|nr:hypothetical protein [Candidatus Symbiobacter sp.]